MNATVTLADATHRQWDVAVIGAGPSGALAARALAQHGHDVVLVDKAEFPRAKVCGGCVNHRAQHALDSAGLGHLLERLGAAQIDGLKLAAASRTASIGVKGYLGITRETLDSALISEAIDVGAAFLPKTRARATTLESKTRSVQVDRDGVEATISARVVIAADGLGGALVNETQDIASASRIGAGAIALEAPSFYRPGNIHMACGHGGYVGLTHAEDGRVDIAAAFDTPFIRERGGLGPAAAAVFEEAGFPVWDGLIQLDWRGTPALTRRNACVAAERIFVVGDAAGYIEPFTGEGIAWAMTTGLAVTEYASPAVQESNRSLEHAWAKRYHQLVTRRQYLCSMMAQALRRPRLMAAAISILKRMPVLARPFVSSVNAKAPLHKTV